MLKINLNMQGTACELSLVSCRRCCGRRKKIKNKKKGCQCIAVRRQKQRNDNKKNKIGIVVQYERALSVIMVNQETEQV